MTEKNMAIAVDGPAGSGKGTLAKRLAVKLGFIYVDTGALYRTIGLFVKNKGILHTDDEGIISCLPDININITLQNSQAIIWLNDSLVSDEIRSSDCSIYASSVSKIPEVREFLVELQRDIARKNNVVMDGRDIGTVILPDADVKIFLHADDCERAKRRLEDMLAKGEQISFEQVLADIRWRDNNDSTRKIAPAVPADDAIMLDNSNFTPDQTFAAALKIVSDRLGI